MNEWKPIETAPTERHTEILGWDGSSCAVFFLSGLGRAKRPLWLVIGDDGFYGDPTHWMPLPEPPK